LKSFETKFGYLLCCFIIHHNKFIGNGEVPLATDNGNNNIWYDITTNECNYWSDYLGTGVYLIEGTAGSIDPYPDGEVVVPELINPSLYALLLIISVIGLGLLSNKRRKNQK
jgi:hypothetical protein